MTEPIKILINDEKVRVNLMKLIDKTEHLQPTMRKIAVKMHKAVEKNFKDEGRPEWDPLADSTKKQRIKKHGTARPILRVSGDLVRSITEKSDNTSAVVGTNLAYARVHQLGFNGTINVSAHSRKVESKNQYQKSRRSGGFTKIKIASGIGYVKDHSRNMKVTARPFLMVTDDDLREINDVIIDDLNII